MNLPGVGAPGVLDNKTMALDSRGLENLKTSARAEKGSEQHNAAIDKVAKQFESVFAVGPQKHARGHARGWSVYRQRHQKLSVHVRPRVGATPVGQGFGIEHRDRSPAQKHEPGAHGAHGRFVGQHLATGPMPQRLKLLLQPI